LVNHNHWSKWFTISRLPPIYSSSFSFYVFTVLVYKRVNN
jgi:hypothetical protein